MKRKERIWSLLLTALMLIGMMTPATVFAENTNIALGKAVQVSDVSSGKGANITDGKTDTYWKSKNSNSEHSATIDLGSERTVSAAKIYTGDGSGNVVTDFKLQYCVITVKGRTQYEIWYDIPGTSVSNNTKQEVLLPFAPVKTTKIKFCVPAKNGKKHQVIVREIMLYETYRDEQQPVDENNEGDNDGNNSSEKEGNTNNREVELNILEIQPGESYELNKSLFSGISGVNKINIVQMPMSQFISSIDDINGKYDIVYIGVNNGSYYSKGKAASKLPQQVGTSNSTTRLSNGSAGIIEYYSANDITNLKAQKLLEFINSGQLAIFHSNVFSDSSTKLYKNFNGVRNTNNVHVTNNINRENIAQWYANSNKRPKVYFDELPVQYNGSENSMQKEKVLQFKFDAYNDENSPMDFKLYIDTNGDGVFKESYANALMNKLSGEDYTLNYRVSENFTGLVPWKIEITNKKTGTKSYVVGSTAFKGEELSVRVLQLKPEAKSFDLSTLSTKSYEINGKKYTSLLERDGEYKINITSITFDEYVKNYPNAVNGKPTKLNGNYDMLIVGFKDSIGTPASEAFAKNPAAIGEIEDFVRTGQSVMLTHDTIIFRTHMPNWDVWAGRFRDLFGQNIYMSDPMPDPGMMSYGFTDKLLDYGSGANNTTTTAYPLNIGLINQYPFYLNDKDITVANTHHQWFQLDLEDEEVIPWYTLKGNGNKHLDGRNDYYTYSKGNLTYSGTGHSDPTALEEQMMFVNTMIKASRGANHAPTLELYGITDGHNISKNKTQLTFSYRAIDIDEADKYLNSDIYIQKNCTGDYIKLDYLHIDAASKLLESGKEKEVTITDIDDSWGDSFKIKVHVFDSSDAKAYKEVTVYRVSLPTVDLTSALLDMSSNLKPGYLLGDVANISLNLSVDNMTSGNRIENIQLESTVIDSKGNVDGTAFEVINSNDWSASEGKITGSLSLDSSKSLQLKTKKVGSFTVKNVLTYDVVAGSVSETKISESSYLIHVKSGKIDVEILDSKGRGVENIPFTIKEENGTVNNCVTGSTGIYTLSDKSSGTYMVSLTIPDGFYEAGVVKTYNVALSYDQPIGEVKIVLSGEIIEKGSVVLASESDGSTIQSIKNGSVYVKIDLTLNRELPDDLRILVNLEKDGSIVDTLSLEYLKSIKVNGEPVTSDIEYRIDEEEENIIILPAGQAAGTYTIYVAVNVGDGVDEPKKADGDPIGYKLGIHSIHFASQPDTEEYDCNTIEPLNINIVALPGLL